MRWCVFAAGVGLIGVTSALAFTHNSETRPTPAPNFDRPIDQIQRSEILEHARSLTFNFDHKVAETDRLVITSSSGVRLSEPVTIAPEIGWAAVSPAEFKEGRIGLVITATEAIPMYGLARGKNYIWVRQTAENEIEARVIPDDINAPMQVQAVSVTRRHHQRPGALVRLTTSGWWYQCPIGCCGTVMR